jgi:hypothetical protein
VRPENDYRFCARLPVRQNGCQEKGDEKGEQPRAQQTEINFFRETGAEEPVGQTDD